MAKSLQAEWTMNTTPLDPTAIAYGLMFDGGGSKVAVRLVDLKTRKTIKDYEYPGGKNPFYNLRETCTLIAEIIGRVTMEHNIDPRNVILSLGWAGMTTQRLRVEGFINWLFPGTLCVLTNDNNPIIIGAHGGQDGANVIIGTGSIAQFIVNGTTGRFGGNGREQDGGSGFWIGYQALLAAEQVRDGTGTSTSLTDYILAKHADLINTRDKAGTDVIGALCKTVFEYHGKGDPVATDILTRGGAHISDLIRSVLDKNIPVSLSGSVAEHILPFVAEDLRTRVTMAPKDAVFDGLLKLATGEATPLYLDARAPDPADPISFWQVPHQPENQPDPDWSPSKL